MKNPSKPYASRDFLAEKEGFEPSRRSTRPTPLAGEPLRPLGYFSKSGSEKIWRREWDSNPRPFRVTGFQDRLLKPLGHLSVWRSGQMQVSSYHSKPYLSTVFGKNPRLSGKTALDILPWLSYNKKAVSGCGEAWYRAWFGSKRPPVRIRPLRPQKRLETLRFRPFSYVFRTFSVITSKVRVW